jgi:hypothetical protein
MLRFFTGGKVIKKLFNQNVGSLNGVNKNRAFSERWRSLTNIVRIVF